jgi:phage shock protein PspC (stress-responsive transcriptional regulator)
MNGTVDSTATEQPRIGGVDDHIDVGLGDVPANGPQIHHVTVGSTGMTLPASNRLSRDSRHKVIAGVCAGIARRYGLSRTGLRLAFVISCVLPGPQFIAYLLLWMLMPAD